MFPQDIVVGADGIRSTIRTAMRSPDAQNEERKAQNEQVKRLFDMISNKH